jgi:hypothetical protein
MRKFYLLFLTVFFVSSLSMAQNNISEKEIDNSNYVVTQKAASQAGSLDVTDPTYNRIFGSPYGANCDGSANTSGTGSNVYYDVYEIHTTVAEAAVISISSSGLGDSYMTLYCSFDPLDPTANIVCGDDDGGSGFMSAFTPADNYLIEANTSYYLVVTSFGNGETGGYTVDMAGNLQFTPAPPSVPLSSWAFAIIGLLAVTFVFIKFRK